MYVLCKSWRNVFTQEGRQEQRAHHMSDIRHTADSVERFLVHVQWQLPRSQETLNFKDVRPASLGSHTPSQLSTYSPWAE
jgi:hypothetical protein